MHLHCPDPKADEYLRRLAATQPRAGRMYLEAVAAFAGKVHEKEWDLDEGYYLLHVLRVALVLAEEAGVVDPEILAAALLHDAREHQARVGFCETVAVAGARAARLAEELAMEHRRYRGLPKVVGLKRYLGHLRDASGCVGLLAHPYADPLPGPPPILGEGVTERSAPGLGTGGRGESGYGGGPSAAARSHARALLLIKMADRLENLRECVRLSKKRALKKRIYQERDDYAAIFKDVPGPEAARLRARLRYFIDQTRLYELPAG